MEGAADHETGETLEGSRFRLYERFDDKDQVNLERDGAVELYGGTDHETYLSKYLDNPVEWDDYRFVATITTDEEGYALLKEFGLPFKNAKN